MTFSQRFHSENALGIILRFPLRAIPSSVVVPILSGPLRGRRWVTGSSDHGCWIGWYELAKQKIFYSSLQPGFVVYDLGANVGFYTLLSSVAVGPRGHVYSFEPLPENVRYLKRHLELNKVSNCTVYEQAVSDGCGPARFSGSGAVGHLDDSGIVVQTVTLDALVSSGSIRAPSVIKCDIEGAEYGALLG